VEAESHSRFYELLIEALNDRGSIYAIGLVTPIDFSFRGGSLSRSFYDRFTQADLSILNPANFIEAPFKVSLRIAGDSCFIIATVIGSALSLVRAPVKELNWSALAHLGVYAINYSTFLGGPINEEPGWRGFALPRLQQRFGPYLATLILAPLCASWHIPSFYLQGWVTVSFWQFLLIVVGISFLLTAAANISPFNILVAILLHAFFNTSSGLVNTLTHGLPPRSYQQTSYALTVLVCGVVFGDNDSWLRANISF
jgi:membrane protease YdiL (CAAX protease family)